MEQAPLLVRSSRERRGRGDERQEGAASGSRREGLAGGAGSASLRGSLLVRESGFEGELPYKAHRSVIRFYGFGSAYIIFLYPVK